jgi:hypothetical protein
MVVMDRPAASRRLSAAAAAERERLERQVRRLETQAAAAAAELQRLSEERQKVRERVTLLEQLAPTSSDSQLSLAGGETSELAAEPPNGLLRGARIRSVAVHLLAASEQGDRPIHYGEWFALLERAGYGVAGKDPIAAFLTQITRSPVVERAGAPGLYRLNLRAPADLRERLRTLQEELTRLHEGQQTLEEIAPVRERRIELTAALGRTERAFEEAVRVLGLAPSGTGSS